MKDLTRYEPRKRFLWTLIAAAFLAIFFLAMSSHGGLGGERPAPLLATGASVSGTAAETEFTLDVSRNSNFNVTAFGSPYRVVIDLPGAACRLPAESGARSLGLVKTYGCYEGGTTAKTRVVLETVGPVRIIHAVMMLAGSGTTARLKVKLVPETKEAFERTLNAARESRHKISLAKSAVHTPDGEEQVKPVVMIDPGHGGIDPGAIGTSGLTEKKIALDVGVALKAELEKTARYRVQMTRERDEYVSLGERARRAREAQARLFVSLHADAIGEKANPRGISGASVYTLSDRASDEEARLRAERENAADFQPGVGPIRSSGEEAAVLNEVLWDLTKRETEGFSSGFARGLVETLRRQRVNLARNPQKSANFVVLRQVEIPSVLIELGYISNPKDEKQMTSSAWQRRTARAITEAINNYFEKISKEGVLHMGTP